MERYKSELIIGIFMVWIAVVFGIILVLIFPKQIGFIFLLIVIAIALLIMRMGTVEKERKAAYLEAKEREERIELAAAITAKNERDSVTINIKYNSKVCNKKTPIYIKIKNNSKRTINKINWIIEAYRKGYSDNVMTGKYKFYAYSTDKIIASNESFGLCYSIPNIKEPYDPKLLVWKHTQKNIQWK